MICLVFDSSVCKGLGGQAEVRSRGSMGAGERR